MLGYFILFQVCRITLAWGYADGFCGCVGDTGICLLMNFKSLMWPSVVQLAFYSYILISIRLVYKQFYDRYVNDSLHFYLIFVLVSQLRCFLSQTITSPALKVY